MAKKKGARPLFDYVLLWVAIAAIFLEYGFIAAAAVPTIIWCILRLEKGDE